MYTLFLCKINIAKSMKKSEQMRKRIEMKNKKKQIKKTEE